MIKHLLIAFLIFGFFISNAQDRQELFLRAEARLKSLNLVDLPSPYVRMDNWISNENNPSFRGGVKHRLDRIETQARDNTGTLIHYQRFAFTYNSDQQLTDFSYYFNEGGAGVFILYSVDHYFYESNKVVKIETESYENSGGSLPIKVRRTNLQYNGKGLVDFLGKDYYVEWLSKYVPESNKIFLYDKNNRLIQDTIYNFYISDSNRIQSAYRKEYTYNDQGLLKEERQYLLDRSRSIWLAYDRNVYTYDSNNFLKLKSLEVRDSVNSTFSILRQYRAIYDSFSGMNLIEHGFWDINANKWDFNEKIEYINDNSFGREDLLIPPYEIYPDIENFNLFNRKLMSDTYSRYFPSLNIWRIEKKTTYIYSEQIVINTEDTKLEGVSFYPNPVESSLSIRNQKGAGIFELFNLQGQKIVHQEVVGDAQVDLSQQMPGFYFYKMTIGGKSATGKLVKN